MAEIPTFDRENPILMPSFGVNQRTQSITYGHKKLEWLPYRTVKTVCSELLWSGLRVWRLTELDRRDVRKPGGIVKEDVKSFVLSHEESQDKDQRRLRIKGNLGLLD